MADLPNVGGVEGSAQYSPMTLVMRYLRDNQKEPTADNIRRALTDNARNPGLIPGLRNAEAEDSAPARPSTRVGRTGGTKPAAGGGGVTDPWDVPTGSGGGGTAPVTDPWDTGQGSPTTSAPPPGTTPGAGGVFGTGWSPNAGQIATAIGLTGLLPAAYFASRYGGTQPGATVPPVPDPGAIPLQPGATPTPGAGQPPLVPDERGIVDYTQLEPGRSPLDTALNRATETPNYVEGVPPVSADAQGNYRPGPSTRVPEQPPPGEGNIPFQARPEGEVRQPPTPEARADLKNRLAGTRKWFSKTPRAPRL